MLPPDEFDTTTPPERFTVTDDSMAEWALRKVAAARRKRHEATKLRDDEQARIDAWYQHVTAAAQRDDEFFTGLLTEYALTERKHGRKSVVLPHGAVKTRTTSASVDVVDEDALIAWAKQNRPDAVKTVDRIMRTELVKHARIENGVWDNDTGEIIPGVVAVSPAVKTTVVIAEAAS